MPDKASKASTFPSSPDPKSPKIPVNKTARDAYERLIAKGVTLPVLDVKVIPADLQYIYKVESMNKNEVYLWTTGDFLNAYNVSAYRMLTLLRPGLTVRGDKPPQKDERLLRVGIPVASLPAVFERALDNKATWELIEGKKGDCYGLVLKGLPPIDNKAYQRWYAQECIAQDSNVAKLRPIYANVETYNYLFQFLKEAFIRTNHFQHAYKASLQPTILKLIIDMENNFRYLYDADQDHTWYVSRRHLSNLQDDMATVSFLLRLAYECGAFQAENLATLMKYKVLVDESLAAWQNKTDYQFESDSENQ